jgi:enediyne polyketide synthase
LPLLGPYVERRVQELIPGCVARVALAQNGHSNHGDDAARTVSAAIGRPVTVVHSPNGKPELAAEPSLSITSSHAGPLTLSVGSLGPLGCDLQEVVARTTNEWRDLLGLARFELAEQLARDTTVDVAAAATLVWTAHESMRKAGWFGDAPLALAEIAPDGWIVLASGPLRVAACVTPIGALGTPTAVAVLARRDDAVV